MYEVTDMIGVLEFSFPYLGSFALITREGHQNTDYFLVL
jgi:hypothetical protein